MGELGARRSSRTAVDKGESGEEEIMRRGMELRIPADEEVDEGGGKGRLVEQAYEKTTYVFAARGTDTPGVGSCILGKHIA